MKLLNLGGRYSWMSLEGVATKQETRRAFSAEKNYFYVTSGYKSPVLAPRTRSYSRKVLRYFRVCVADTDLRAYVDFLSCALYIYMYASKTFASVLTTNIMLGCLWIASVGLAKLFLHDCTIWWQRNGSDTSFSCSTALSDVMPAPGFSWYVYSFFLSQRWMECVR